MCRVLVRGMQALGLRLPGDGTRSEAQAARVPLADKPALVAAAVQQGGLVCLAQLGQGLHGLAFEPTHQALATAGSARGLFERWARLERYIHTRHRTLLLACEQGPAGGQALLRHVSRSGAPPLAAEDLVVLGVLAALLQALGLQQVQAWAGGVMVLPQADAAGLQAAAAVVHTRQASVTSRNSRNSHTSDWRL